MEAHKLASYFPIMEEEKFEKFKEDIKENGQLEPIITFNNQILDGLNRYRACTELGITPIFKEYKGKDPLHYVISVNVHRRHMSVSQLAMVATEMLPEFEKEAKERQGIKGSASKDAKVYTNHEGFSKSALQAAKEFGISQPSVERAKRVKEQAPEKVPDIISGKVSVGNVDNELRMKAAVDRAEVKQKEAVEEKVKERPQAVKDFLTANTEYKNALTFAIEVAKRGLFSEESKNFIENRCNIIQELSKELKELI